MPNNFNETIVNVISRNKSYFEYDVENPLTGVLKELHVLELNQICVNLYLSQFKIFDSMYS